MPLLKGFCFVLTRTFISSVRLDVFKHRSIKAEARISARKTRRGLISEMCTKLLQIPQRIPGKHQNIQGWVCSSLP